jgi:hypothetical protein
MRTCPCGVEIPPKKRYCETCRLDARKASKRKSYHTTRARLSEDQLSAVRESQRNHKRKLRRHKAYRQSEKLQKRGHRVVYHYTGRQLSYARARILVSRLRLPSEGTHMVLWKLDGNLFVRCLRAPLESIPQGYSPLVWIRIEDREVIPHVLAKDKSLARYTAAQVRRKLGWVS